MNPAVMLVAETDNTGAIITASGSILTIVVGLLLGYFVKRTGRASRMTQANMIDQQYVMKLVSVLRDDYWALDDYTYSLRSMARRFRERLANLGLEPAEQIPEKPDPKHRGLEAKHAAGEPWDSDD